MARIVVFGIVAWYPLAGVRYQFLHYLLGLRRLGYDAYYVEDSRYELYDPWSNAYAARSERNIAVLAELMDAHGFGDRWAFRGLADDGDSVGPTYGMTEQRLLQLYRDADAALNVTAGTALTEEHLRIRRRIYIESDPFSAQARAVGGDVAMQALLAGHDTHFSFGENIGAPDCDVPTAGYSWLPTRQPVDLDLWAGGDAASDDAPYNTVTTWQNPGRELVYRGETYHWTKDREFERFIDLPQRRSVPFELATGVDATVRASLERHGWRVVDALPISLDTGAYRDYIQGSRGEFTVARDQYVRPRTGWFSDRSACYLAAGRPVITQETGFSRFLPTGRGLFAFTTMDDVLSAVDAVESDPVGHGRAAREIAAEYFAAEKVVADLMRRAGL